MAEYESVKTFSARVASPASTIREMCCRGKLPAVKIGKEWKIDVTRAMDMFRQQMDERMEIARQREARHITLPHPGSMSGKSNYLESLNRLKRECMARAREGKV